MKFEALVEFCGVSSPDLSEDELDGVSSEGVSTTDLPEDELVSYCTRIVTMSVLSEGFGGLLFVSKDSSINLYCPGSTPAALMSTTVDDERFFRVTKAS